MLQPFGERTQECSMNNLVPRIQDIRHDCSFLRTPEIGQEKSSLRNCCQACDACEKDCSCKNKITDHSSFKGDAAKRNSQQGRCSKRNDFVNTKASKDEYVAGETHGHADGSAGSAGSPWISRKTINCNLDRFLEYTCPSVQPLYLPKSCRWEACQRRLKRGQEEPLPYFSLADLWESFDEWSAYGAGVPIMLNGKETVVQYYAPYLSAIQLYTVSGRKAFVKFKRRVEDSDLSDDGDCRDSLSEASSDGEGDKVPNCWGCECGQSLRRDTVNCCVCDGFENDRKIPKYKVGELVEDSGWNWRGHLLFEYFEEFPPHARVPFIDKIAELAQHFPQLRTLRSVDLLPASWMSIAWYPIYRIPTGPTLQDLSASFLTYHCLSTSWQDGTPLGIVEPTKSPAACSVSVLYKKGVPRINLQAFGLAHYKLRGSIWTSAGNQERRHASSLFRCAESWLRCLGIQHPDFMFFISHNPASS